MHNFTFGFLQNLFSTVLQRTPRKVKPYKCPGIGRAQVGNLLLVCEGQQLCLFSIFSLFLNHCCFIPLSNHRNIRDLQPSSCHPSCCLCVATLLCCCCSYFSPLSPPSFPVDLDSAGTYWSLIYDSFFL